MKRGDRVGRFRILRQLGEGGMGKVFLATDQESYDYVALKTLSDEAREDPDVVARFRREIAVAKKFCHPNVVRFVDAGEHEGVPFIAMEYITGVSLEQLLERGALPREAALSVLQDVAYALFAAHQAGIVHRDVKPENVMITQDDTLKLIDFGIASAAKGKTRRSEALRDVAVKERSVPGGPREDDALQRVTQFGDRVGTPYYSSPEQNRGEEVTTASDIYSLGLLFLEMLTGKCPYDANNLIELVQQQIALKERCFGPDASPLPLSDELRRILERMLSYFPKERYPSARELVADLDRALVREGLSTANELLHASKEEARVEITEACYWSGATLLDQGRFPEALLEFEQLLDVQTSRLELYKGRMRAQLRFLLWQLHLARGTGEADDAESQAGVLLTLSRLMARLDDRLALRVTARRLARVLGTVEDSSLRLRLLRQVMATNVHSDDPTLLGAYEELCRSASGPAEAMAARRAHGEVLYRCGLYDQALLTFGAIDDEAARRRHDQIDIARRHRDEVRTSLLNRWTYAAVQQDGRGAMDAWKAYLQAYEGDAAVWERLAGVASGVDGAEAREAWRRAGTVRFLAHEDGKARADFMAALELDRADRDALFVLFELFAEGEANSIPSCRTEDEVHVYLLLRCGFVSEALEEFESHRAETEGALRQYDELMSWCRKNGIALQEGYLHFRMGLLALAIGRDDLARDHFHRSWDGERWDEARWKAFLENPGSRRLYGPMELARLRARASG